MPHRQPLGTECGLFYDTDMTVEIGDVVRTSAGTCYRVISVREASERSKYYGVRKHLRCVRISEDDVADDDFIHPLHWYGRG